MNLLNILILLLLTTPNLQAKLYDQAKIDSLLTELPKSNKDSNHVKLLCLLSDEIKSINPDDGIKYAKEGLTISEKLDWNKGKAISYYSLGVNYLNKLLDGNLKNDSIVMAYYTRALEISEDNNFKYVYAETINDIGIIYGYRGDYEKKLEYFQKSISISEKYNFLDLIVITSGNISNIYYQKLEYSKALDYLLIALKYSKKSGNVLDIISTYNRLARFYEDRSDNKKALDYYFKSLEASKKIDNKKWMAEIFMNIGVLYAKNSNFNKALKYFNKAFNINETEVRNNDLKISTLNNIANIYFQKNDYSKALEYYQIALDFTREIENLNQEMDCLGGIGKIYKTQSNYPKALEIYHEMLNIAEKTNNLNAEAYCYILIGTIFRYQLDYKKGLEYSFKGIEIFKKLGKKFSLMDSYIAVGILYYYWEKYPEALEYYKKAQEINKIIKNPGIDATLLINIGLIHYHQQDYNKAEDFLKDVFDIVIKLKDKFNIAFTSMCLGNLYKTLAQDSILQMNSIDSKRKWINKELNLNKAIRYYIESNKYFEEVGDLYDRSKCLLGLSEVYEQKQDYKNQIKYYKLHISLRDSIYNEKNTKKISNLEKAREDDINQMKIEKQEILLKAQEDEKQFILMSASGALVSVILILIIIINQRRKSEKLLLNILPSPIAKRLKSKEENIADDFDSATTVFIDLVGFTSFAKDKNASEVVKVLNNIFHRFDDLVNKHCLEKIKTMGDGYLAVSGVPDPKWNHCQKATNFALEVKTELEKFNNEMNLDINARIGLESGPLVAGVIGSSKFIYDIWGDTVNTASRMESTGMPGKIQITENVKVELEKHETNLQFEKREVFEVKGKGLMQTYYVSD